jgi:3-dehydroquinate dehydratase-2
MPKILIIHGAGMNMRGKVQTDIFGPMKLPEYDERIRGYAAELFNPAGFSRGYPALVAAINQVAFPTIEVHMSNPVRRGPVSDTATVSRGMVTGFGIAGYYLALRGVRDTLTK